MAKCAYCGTRILLGGVRSGDLRYCNQDCARNGLLIPASRQLADSFVQEEIAKVHDGLCPHCKGPGPVDVHQAYRVYSVIILTTYATKTKVCCRTCAVKSQVGNLLICLFFGWWGFPFGFIITPIQIVRNIIALCTPPAPQAASPLLETLVRVNLGRQVIVRQQMQKPVA
jgi:hypothetical protein